MSLTVRRTSPATGAGGRNELSGEGRTFRPLEYRGCLMITLRLLLLVLAFISFAIAAFGVPSRVNLIAVGLALWVLTLLIA